MRDGDIDNLIAAVSGFGLQRASSSGIHRWTIGEAAVAAVPVLIELLKFGDVEDRKLAATVLGLMGHVAGDAAEELLETANYDPDDVVAKLAMSALERVEMPETVELRQAA